MVARTVAELGRLDIFVSSAVYSEREPFCTADMAGFRRTIDVTMWGAFYGLRASANQMIRQGQGGNAVLVSSPQAHVPIPGRMAYNMAKAASIRWPGPPPWSCLPSASASTSSIPAGPTLPANANFSPRKCCGARLPALPWGRLARPEEIARGILFLVDPDSDYITGSTLSIDGGAQLPWWSKRGTGEIFESVSRCGEPAGVSPEFAGVSPGVRGR